MGNTRDTGYLRNLVVYDGSGNITLPANLTVLGTITGYATTSYVGTQLVGYAPATRTLTINGTAYDLSADRSWTITSMIYPTAGISVSTGSAWGTSITDNSANWNTAFGWGNHAIAGYLTGITSGQVTTALGFTPYNATNPTGYITSAALSTYATESYVGTQIANLVASAPATLDTLNELAAALGNDAAFSTTISTALGNRLRVDINTQGLSATLQGYGRTNLGLGTAATSATGDFAAASHTHSIANVTGLQTALDGKVALTALSFAAGSGAYNSTTGVITIPTNNNQLTNGAGYITGTIPTNNNQLTNGAGYITSSGSISGNAATATKLASGQSTWSGTGIIDSVVGMLAWKNYGNSHVIFDASQSTSPSGTAVNNTNAGTAWSAAYPTLMGWNGAGTYGVRVDSARISDSTSSVAWTNVSSRPTAVSSFTNDSAYLTSVGIGNMTDVHRLFNNMGNGHGTYQDFNSVGNFGVRYMQGSTNGPQSGQHYGFTLGLGNDYTIGTYGTQFYWLRNTTNPYIYIRYQEAGSWGAWTKAAAGNADNVSSISNAVGGAYIWTGVNQFQSNRDTSSNSAMLQAFSSSGGATMAFHRGAVYATNMGLDSDNVFRIGGWSAGNNRLQMDMSGNLTMAGDVTAYSDARVKENIITVDNALNKVLALRGVYYNRIDSDDKKTKIGVIAQETLQVVPEVVNQDAAGMYNVSYGNLAGLFIEAFKEQQKEIEELKNLIYGITR